MVIWGRQDRFINVELAHEIAETLPNTELEVVDQSGHYVHIDKPQELARAVTKFLYEPA
jgi:pimeloyl-ACP methyl ester carboxylesterase